jgi:hypothetical protein
MTGDVAAATMSRPPPGFVSQTAGVCVDSPKAGPLLLAPLPQAVCEARDRYGPGNLRYFAYEFAGFTHPRLLWEHRLTSHTHARTFIPHGGSLIGEIGPYESIRGPAVAPERGLGLFAPPAAAKLLPAMTVRDHRFVRGTGVIRHGEPGLTFGGVVADLRRTPRISEVTISVDPGARVVGSPVDGIWGEPENDLIALLLRRVTPAEDLRLRSRIPKTSATTEALESCPHNPGDGPVTWAAGPTGGEILRLMRYFDVA